MIGSIAGGRARALIACTALSAGLALAISACSSEVSPPTQSASGSGAGAGGSASTGSGTGTGAGGPVEPVKADKIDLLLEIDNSRSMADKQALLALAVPDLVLRLVNPECVDDQGVPAPSQPPSPEEDCPAGFHRVFAPVEDIHIGVISSSLGSHGGDACLSNIACGPGAPAGPPADDQAHLLHRPDPCAPSSLPTYDGEGFLAWDPRAAKSPPGEDDPASLIGALTDMVIGVGQVGCGYESQLESWYRFLVDPAPYASLAVVGGNTTPMGVDEVLLAQRAELLRPDSLLVVVMLTDENDCSTRDSGQHWMAAQLKDPGGGATAFHLPRPRQECAANPADPCCLSCAGPQEGCPPDPTCDQGPLGSLEDNVNLRCFDQKRRFGIDFLNPIGRYVAGLTSAQVPTADGSLVDNPIFGGAPGARAPGDGRVVLAGIVGVPWQDIARDPADLSKGFKSAAALAEIGPWGSSTWDAILGDPAAYVQPLDPHMIESSAPRSGANPITGAAIAPPGSPNGTDPINGHEYSIPDNDDLEYACIFPLSSPRDCSPGGPQQQSCDCAEATNDNPLCEPNPNDGGSPTLQTRAKAYPGRRELQLLKSLDDTAVVTSICPAQTDDPAAPDYAYRPVAAALIERMALSLQ